MMLKIVLKEGRDRTLLRGHPWVFADGIHEMVDAPAGQVVEVWSHRNAFLGTAFYNVHSSISLRMLSRQRVEISGAWIKDQKLVIEDGSVVEYRVVMMVTFVLND